MEHMTDLIIIASNHIGSAGIDEFWSTGAGRIIATFLDVLGLGALIFGGFKAWKHIADGKTGQGIKVALGMAVLASFLLFPQMFGSLAETIGKIAQVVIDSFGDIAG